MKYWHAVALLVMLFVFTSYQRMRDHQYEMLSIENNSLKNRLEILEFIQENIK